MPFRHPETATRKVHQEAGGKFEDLLYNAIRLLTYWEPAGNPLRIVGRMNFILVQTRLSNGQSLVERQSQYETRERESVSAFYERSAHTGDIGSRRFLSISAQSTQSIIRTPNAGNPSLADSARCVHLMFEWR